MATAPALDLGHACGLCGLPGAERDLVVEFVHDECAAEFEAALLPAGPEPVGHYGSRLDALGAAGIFSGRVVEGPAALAPRSFDWPPGAPPPWDHPCPRCGATVYPEATHACGGKS